LARIMWLLPWRFVSGDDGRNWGSPTFWFRTKFRPIRTSASKCCWSMPTG